jgi:mRNA-degrading endonuclease YafQ of YafQ-DinJ toxin-antitoxin module
MKKSDIRFVLYASGHRVPDVYSRSYVPVFYTAHEARSWLDRFIAGKPYERDGNTIRMTAEFDIAIRSEQLDEILAAPLANEPLRADYAQHILRFKYGTWDEVHAKPDLLEDSDDGMVVNKMPKPDRAARVDKPDAFVTITELCATSGVLPRIARAALRASGREKPAYGWAFDPKEVPDIKKLIGVQ